jgi:hypothetical protein
MKLPFLYPYKENSPKKEDYYKVQYEPGKKTKTKDTSNSF